MKLSILGSGRVAYSVARRAIAAGHEIVIGTRDPSKIDREKWLELPSVKFTSISEAGLDNVVLLAVPWEHVDHILEQIPTWDRRILIDAAHQHAKLKETPRNQPGRAGSDHHDLHRRAHRYASRLQRRTTAPPAYSRLGA